MKKPVVQKILCYIGEELPMQTFDAVTDKVLAYKPKPKTKAAKRRAKSSRKLTNILPSL